MSRSPVFLGLGSNVGDREATLARSLERLEQSGFHVTGRSSLYETEPVGAPPQAWFLNGVVRGETALTPEGLLERCLFVESELGRIRDQPRGPRTLDVDLLLYGDVVSSGAGLALPHPRMHERLFVLVPLAELEPGARHPVLNLTAVEMMRRCADRSRVLLHSQPLARP